MLSRIKKLLAALSFLIIFLGPSIRLEKDLKPMKENKPPRPTYNAPLPTDISFPRMIEALEQTPTSIYTSTTYTQITEQRPVRVLMDRGSISLGDTTYNLPTWLKQIEGKWYFSKVDVKGARPFVSVPYREDNHIGPPGIAYVPCKEPCSR